ncbi:Nuclear autoantigenic sperm, partial [Globisporangium splendens]
MASATDTAAAAVASDAAQVLEKTTVDPRFTRGQTLLKEKRLEEAVVVYEDLLRTMCVLRVFAGQGLECIEGRDIDDSSVFGGAVAQPEEGGDPDAEQDAKNMADDLEVAWEMLEVARVIYSRYPDELAVEKELARVYMRLGDLGMESDVFEQAKSDYEKSLMLRQKILKETKDPDTTLLADLYCCLAISCIYQDSATQAAAAGVDDEGVDLGVRQAEIRKREDEGLKFYVLAGRVMAANIHRVASACPKELQVFVDARIPKYAGDGSALEPDPTAPAAASKGKGKLKASADKQELLFTAEHMDAMRDEFLACVQVLKSLKSSDVVTDHLTKDEAQLLEYLEIYVELKEKVDGIIESASAEAVDNSAAAASSGSKRSADAMEKEEPVTTIGFGTTASTSAVTTTTAAPVNVMNVVKKRKVVAPAAAAEAADVPAADAVKAAEPEDK